MRLESRGRPGPGSGAAAQAVVDPSGASKQLTAGWLSASFRATDERRSRVVRGVELQPWHPFTRESAAPLEPGKATRLDVEGRPHRTAQLALDDGGDRREGQVGRSGRHHDQVDLAPPHARIRGENAISAHAVIASGPSLGVPPRD